MAIAVSFNPTKPAALQLNTITFSGLAATTAYQVTVKDASGHSTVILGTSDGGGGLAVKFTPQLSGTLTTTVVLAPAAAVFTDTRQCGGHG